MVRQKYLPLQRETRFSHIGKDVKLLPKGGIHRAQETHTLGLFLWYRRERVRRLSGKSTGGITSVTLSSYRMKRKSIVSQTKIGRRLVFAKYVRKNGKIYFPRKRKCFVFWIED